MPTESTMPPQVDPTSGVPIMEQNTVYQNHQSTPAQPHLSTQQIHQQSLGNAAAAFTTNHHHHNQPQMLNTPNGMQMIYPHMQKSKLVMLLFAILLGWTGAHNFYLGHNGKAIAQLLISLLSVGILAFIPALWAIIEGVMLFGNSNAIDANGIPLKD